MSVKNLTKKIKIAEYYIYYKSDLSKAAGLMFRKKLKDKALIFSFRNERIVPLHMLFVFFPIDVLFLNNEKIVVEIKKNFKPFTFYKPKNKAKFILELPKGTIKETKTEVNDRLSF